MLSISDNITHWCIWCKVSANRSAFF